MPKVARNVKVVDAHMESEVVTESTSAYTPALETTPAPEPTPNP